MENNSTPFNADWTFPTIPRMDFSRITYLGYGFTSKSIEYIDFYINSSSCTSAPSAFAVASNLKRLKGIDLSKCTSVRECFNTIAIEVIEEPLNLSSVTSAYNGDRFLHGNALREVRFVPETIKWSMAFSSPVLSAESIQSTFDGLNSEVTGQTLTLPLTAVKRAFETSKGANDGNTSETWNALVASKPNWTITLS